MRSVWKCGKWICGNEEMRICGYVEMWKCGHIYYTHEYIRNSSSTAPIHGWSVGGAVVVDMAVRYLVKYWRSSRCVWAWRWAWRWASTGLIVVFGLIGAWAGWLADGASGWQEWVVGLNRCSLSQQTPEDVSTPCGISPKYLDNFLPNCFTEALKRQAPKCHVSRSPTTKIPCSPSTATTTTTTTFLHHPPAFRKHESISDCYPHRRIR